MKNEEMNLVPATKKLLEKSRSFFLVPLRSAGTNINFAV